MTTSSLTRKPAVAADDRTGQNNLPSQFRHWFGRHFARSLPSKKAKFALRIFNPDGSEAEKSGNGLRIFSRYLFDKKLVGKDEFDVETPAGW